MLSEEQIRVIEKQYSARTTWPTAVGALLRHIEEVDAQLAAKDAEIEGLRAVYANMMCAGWRMYDYIYKLPPQYKPCPQVHREWLESANTLANNQRAARNALESTGTQASEEVQGEV